MWSQTQTINGIKLLTVGSTDIKSFNVGQASQHLVYGQQSPYKHVTGISLQTHLFNAYKRPAHSNNDKENQMWDKKPLLYLKRQNNLFIFHCF